LVRPVFVAELPELAQGVQQMPLIPDQGPVEQLAAGTCTDLSGIQKFCS
jgi:hypothetical protein